MWLSTIFGSAPESTPDQLLPRLAVLLMCLGGLLASRRRLPELLGRMGIAGVVILSPLLLGASGRVAVESVVAGVVGASIRFLMPHRQPLRTVLAGYLGAAAVAQWVVPAVMRWQKWSPDLAPFLAFLGGLAALELCRLVIEKLPELIAQRFSTKAETP